MAVYIAIASVLFLLALLEVGARTRGWATISLLILTAFAALRFETGFDWIPYESVFDEAPTIAGSARNEGPDPSVVAMEQLYILLNSVVKTFTDNVVVLFAIVAIFAIVTMHQVTGRISHSQSLVWLVYFCLVFLAVQMSSIRSAISSSIVLIGLMLAGEQRPISALLAIAVATGFHSAAAIFLPLPLLSNWRPNNRVIVVTVALGLAAAFLGIQPIDPLIDLFTPYLPLIVAEKLMLFYRGLAPASISTGTYSLILGQLSLLFVLCRSSGEKDQRDPFIIIAIWLTLMMLSAHLLLAGFPAIWNRIMYVALPWQIASLCRTETFVRLGLGARRLIVCGLGSVSMAGLVYFLVSPASLPFIPYQSVIEVWLSGDSGDGRERSLQWYAIVGNPAAGRVEQ